MEAIREIVRHENKRWRSNCAAHRQRCAALYAGVFCAASRGVHSRSGSHHCRGILVNRIFRQAGQRGRDLGQPIGESTRRTRGGGRDLFPLRYQSLVLPFVAALTLVTGMLMTEGSRATTATAQATTVFSTATVGADGATGTTGTNGAPGSGTAPPGQPARTARPARAPMAEMAALAEPAPAASPPMPAMSTLLRRVAQSRVGTVAQAATAVRVVVVVPRFPGVAMAAMAAAVARAARVSVAADSP